MKGSKSKGTKKNEILKTLFFWVFLVIAVILIYPEFNSARCGRKVQQDCNCM